MKCSNCGKEIPNGSQFCNHCGTKIVAPEEIRHNELECQSKKSNAPIINKPDTKKNKAPLIGAAIAIILIVVAIIVVPIINRQMKYNQSIEALRNGDYDTAYELYEGLGKYNEEQAREFYETAILQYCENNEFDRAGKVKHDLYFVQELSGSYLSEWDNYIDYQEALFNESEGNYKDAYYAYYRLGDYEDSTERTKTIFDNHKDVFYELALQKFKLNNLAELDYARQLFEMLGEYEKSEAYIHFIDGIVNMRGTYKCVRSTSRYSYGYDDMFMVDFGYAETATEYYKKYTSVGSYYQYEGYPCLVVDFYGNGKSCVLLYSDGHKLYKRKASIVDGKITDIGDASSFTRISNSTEPLTEPKIGMTASEVENSMWGKPEKINTTSTVGGESEQWVYSISRYVYLKNGVVTSIQTSTESEINKNSDKVEFDFEIDSITDVD